MINNTKRFLSGATLLLALLAIAACGRATPTPTPQVVRETVVVTQEVVRVVRETVVVEVTPTPPTEPVTVRLNLGVEPSSIDPALATGSAAADVVEALFLGLTDTDQAGNVVPELATAWDVSEDGLAWTFLLRDDVPWVTYRPSTGAEAVRPVVAGDVAYAVRRTCDPRTGSPLAFLDYPIAGCQALHTADLASLGAEEIQALIQGVGVRALDDYTVQFTLDAPTGDFPAVAGLPINRPVPSETIAELGDRWTEAGHIVTSGPYGLASWVHGDSLAMEQNRLWPGWTQAPGNVQHIDLAMITDDTVALETYASSRLDSVEVPSAILDQVLSDPLLSQELVVVQVPCTEYLGFNNARPPLDNPLVRQALAAAVDRAALVASTTGGGEIPANTFAPAGVFGSAAGDPAVAPWTLPAEQGGWGYQRSLEQARAWLAEAGYPDGQGLPPIFLLHNAAETRTRVAEAITAMWQDGLGIAVETASLDWQDYRTRLGAETPSAELSHAWLMAHCGDYPDQAAWLGEVFGPESGDPLRWREAGVVPQAADGRRVDDLLAAARASADPQERQALYREAEIALADGAAAYAPLYHYAEVHLTKPYLQRTYRPGLEHFETWIIHE